VRYDRTSLPGEILLEIFSNLGGAPALGRCRCVCKSWRTLVDTHSLLLLPRALSRDAFFPGFLANTVFYVDPCPLFLSPPSTLPAPEVEVDKLDFLRPHLPLSSCGATVRDHCNGLVLCFQGDAGFVCNPATKRWARLPHPPTAPLPWNHEGLFLTFDPAVSPHYQVFLLPAALPVRGAMVIRGRIVPGSGGDQQLERLFNMKKERNKKAVPVLVFSSEDGRWTRRVFAAGRCSPGHLYDRVMAPDQRRRTWRSAAYRHVSLYVQSESRVLVALRCLEGTYDMVKLPGDATLEAIGVVPPRGRDSIFLSPVPETGGVLRYATVNKCRVKVWGLREPAGHGHQLEWTLTHDKDLELHVNELARKLLACAWRWPDQASHGDRAGNSWDEAMDRGVLDLEPDEEQLHGFMSPVPLPRTLAILGPHPSKEVIFFAGSSKVLMYDLVSSKVRYIGDLASHDHRIEAVFPYRPCFIDALPLSRYMLNSHFRVIYSHHSKIILFQVKL
jgi:hypothetical protein